MRDLTLENPIRAIREMSHDMTGRKTVRLANGARAVRPADPARVPRAGAGVRRPRGPRRTRSTSRSSTCGGARSTPSRPATSARSTPRSTGSSSTGSSRGYRAKHDLPMEHPRIAQLDLAYHDINRRAGSSTSCRRTGGRPASATDLEIFEAKTCPPQTTRAKLRGDFIRAAQEHRRDFTVDWVHLKLNDQAQRTVLCKDPFAAVDDARGAAHRRHARLTASRSRVAATGGRGIATPCGYGGAGSRPPAKVLPRASPSHPALTAAALCRRLGAQPAAVAPRRQGAPPLDQITVDRRHRHDGPDGHDQAQAPVSVTETDDQGRQGRQRRSGQGRRDRQPRGTCCSTARTAGRSTPTTASRTSASTSERATCCPASRRACRTRRSARASSWPCRPRTRSGPQGNADIKVGGSDTVVFLMDVAGDQAEPPRARHVKPPPGLPTVRSKDRQGRHHHHPQGRQAADQDRRPAAHRGQGRQGRRPARPIRVTYTGVLWKDGKVFDTSSTARSGTSRP